ncbi:MAG: twin-arginine translocase subunit TatC [Planctomycetota bacterium]|nr:MAG: twin-arginine translocase subunit TatC [Planctomycetota bacterium]
MRGDDGDQSRMQLGDHLEELRWRLIKIVVAILVCTIVAFIFNIELKLIALQPLQQAVAIVGEDVAEQLGFSSDPAETRQLRGGTLTEPAITAFTVSMLAAAFVVFPYIVWQLWGFVRPALYRHETGLAFLFVPSAVLFFYLGAILGYAFALPWFYAWLMHWAVMDPTVTMILDQRQYFRLLVLMTACFGVILDIPWFVILLVRLRIMTPQTIAKGRRYVVLGAIVIAALLSPPDPFSQMAMFLPMVILFELGLFISRIIYRRRLLADGASSPL